MSYDVSKLSKLADLKSLAERIESDFAKKSAVTALSNRVDELVTAGG